jgi:hypothetical protein
MSFDSTFEIILNDFSKKIIFSIVEISLIEQIDDILVEKFAIRSNKIQFIFEESIRVEIDSIVVLNRVKDFERIIRRWWFDDDHVDEQIENLLHESSINQEAMNLIWIARLINVSSLQLVTRNVVIVNYVDAWVRWWMIFIKWLHSVLYRWSSISSHVKYFAHMLDTRFVT